MEDDREEAAGPRRPRRFGFRISLRAWLFIVAVVGVVVGLQYRRSPITPRNAASLRPVATLEKDDIYKIAWARDRGRMAVVGWEKPVEIRDAVSLGLIETISEGKKIIDFAFSPRDDIVAYCENGKTAVILDRRTGKTWTLDAKNDQPVVVFSPDGTLLATGGYGTFVRLWRVADGALVRTFDVGPVAGGLTPEFSPDGRLLAVGNRNSTTALFDVATGTLLHTLPRAMSQELQFHPGGKILAVAYVDGSVALWDVAEGKLLRGRKPEAEELYTLDWSPDGSILATAGRQGKITLWDPRDLSVIRSLPAPEWVVRVKFSPDGLSLHNAGGQGTVGGKRRLEVLGIEGSLYTLLNRPRP